MQQTWPGPVLQDTHACAGGAALHASGSHRATAPRAIPRLVLEAHGTPTLAAGLSAAHTRINAGRGKSSRHLGASVAGPAASEACQPPAARLPRATCCARRPVSSMMMMLLRLRDYSAAPGWCARKCHGELTSLNHPSLNPRGKHEFRAHSSQWAPPPPPHTHSHHARPTPQSTSPPCHDRVRCWVCWVVGDCLLRAYTYGMHCGIRSNFNPINDTMFK